MIYESSSRAGHGWRESLYRHQGCLKLLIVGESAVRLLVTLEALSACEKLPKILLGCVNDVLAVEQYLVDTIKVNSKHIKKLLAPFQAAGVVEPHG
jgi:hypothetical protein